MEELYVTSTEDWRNWLETNHDSKSEIWLIFYRKHTNKPSLSYNSAVEEALCFGWIDSTIKKLDEEKYARKFTPRKAQSRWSELNRNRANRMIMIGKMREAGWTKIKEAKKSGEWFRKSSRRSLFTIPPFVEKALTANKKAHSNFSKLAPSYKRQYIGWIIGAKKEGTRMKRLKETIKLLEENQKLGMK